MSAFFDTTSAGPSRTPASTVDSAVPDPAPSAPNPLQLGQVLYPILDVSVVAVPHGVSAAQYNRVRFTSDGGSALDALAIDPLASIIDVRAPADMHAAAQPVFVLTATALRRIGSANGAASEHSWPIDGSSLRGIVGMDPQLTASPTLLLLGQDDAAPYLQWFDCGAGKVTNTLALPALSGSVRQAVLVRRQLSARVVVCTVADGKLLACDLGAGVLGASPAAPAQPTTLTLGNVADDVVVTLCVASLQPGPDQQVAVAFADAGGALQLAVLGWDENGTFTTVAASRADALAAGSGPKLCWEDVERPVYRLAAADLCASGHDQLVVGFATRFGGVAGSVALLLLELQTDGRGKVTGLTLLSTYVAAGTDGTQPLASIDLHLAAGLFGEALAADASGSPSADSGVLGVLVIGAAATAEQLFSGSAAVLTGLVTVSPNGKTFPPVASTPVVPQLLSAVATLDAGANAIFAVPSDVTGQSVFLGPPSFTQREGKGQLLAIVSAPPFENSPDVSVQAPSLSFSQGQTDMQGYNVSSNKMWMFSNDIGGSIGIGSVSLGQQVNRAYGHGFDKVDDSSTTTTVQTASIISSNDMLVTYAVSYDVWEYPVYRKARQNTPDGTMAVIFPQSASSIQTILLGSDASIGYKPRSQVGTLMSYANVSEGEFPTDGLLFVRMAFTVSDDSGGTLVTYDHSKMDSDNTMKTYTVHNSTTDSAHFSLSTTLFDYVPVNFGLNLGSNTTYSDNDVQTTSISITDTLSITVTSGAVKDVGYAYEITPYIYQHKTMGCLVVTYQVNLNGELWSSYPPYTTPQIMLVSLLPNSESALLRGFTRSVTFTDRSDGTTDVKIELLNNSLQAATSGVTCELFAGAPVVFPDGSAIIPPNVTPVTQTLPSLAGASRGTLTFPGMKLPDGQQLTLKVYSTGQAGAGHVYWTIYPASAFADWKQQLESEHM